MKANSSLFSVGLCLCLLIFSLGLQISGPLLVLTGCFLALFLPFLWIGKGRFFLFLFLGVFIPLFPTVGIEIGGRILNWFDLFLLVFVLWNGLHFFNDEVRSRLDLVSLGSLLFLGFLLWSVFRSPDPVISARDYISYGVNFFLVYWIASRFSEVEMENYYWGIFLSSIVVFLVAAFQKINGFTFPTVEDGEVTIRLGVPGTFDDSLVLSMYAGIMAIFCLMAILRYQSSIRLLAWVCFFLNLVSLRFSLSRNGMFILAVALLCFLFFRFMDWMRDRRRATAIPVMLFALPVFGLATLKVLPADVYHRIVSILYLFQGSNDQVILYNIRSTLGRFENYKMALKMFLEEPIEGIGLGMYPVLTKFHDADGFYPGLLAETGLIGCAGFLLFVLCLGIALYRSYKASRKEMSSSQLYSFQLFCSLTIALLAVSFFEPVFKVQWVSFTFFLMLRQVTAHKLEWDSRAEGTSDESEDRSSEVLGVSA